MAMDMSKNGNALSQAYNDVVSDKKDTDWVVFGYEGNTNILKVYETGDGGIEEMVDELNSGKIMYAYCRVKDPNTDLPKYVLINWQGEGAPDSVKLKCTQHIKDMTSWLRTIHVTINARTDDDVDADEVMKKVAKASGANYSFHKEKARPVEAPTPVGSVYKKTVAAKDIRGSSRDEFWAKTEKEEHERQDVERKRKMSENEQMEKERKEREAQEAKERDQRMIERMRAVNDQKRAEKQASMVNRENEKNKWDKEQQEMLHDDETRRKRSESLRKERVMEAQALTSSSASSARDYFKQKSVERPDDASRRPPPPPKKLQHGFLAQEEEEEPQRKAPIQLPSDEPSSPPPSKPARQPEPEPEPEYEPEPVYQTEPEPFEEPAAAPQLPQTRNLLQQGLPPLQDSDEEEEEQNWEEPSQEDYTPSTAGQVIPTSAGNVQEEVEYEGIENVPGGDKGLCATALYDYQAADESEITFDPGDIITNIEQIDAGWWTGTGPDGSSGMFPANYVELIE